MSPFISRRERFGVVGSTNDVVRGWLADGSPEVCVAQADVQTAGRGRDGRAWTAPAGGALLVSLGFRPTWLEPDRVWRLAAAVSMAMAEAAESAAGLAPGTIRLKWPNDLVAEDGAGVRKLAGVLGESDGLGTADPRAVIGIGVNGAWPAAAFPPELAPMMTSLQALAGDRRIDHEQLLDDFLERLETRVQGSRDGGFDVDEWADRQVTTGRWVEIHLPDGDVAELPAIGVDGGSGALVVIDPAAPDVHRLVLVGDIRHVRLAATMATGV
jgi:BirA family transcriptional regulator, biotin operon repressor / biotin---[acetyl-CoA-carboxylase] ligase